jgi:hypothetical protein
MYSFVLFVMYCIILHELHFLQVNCLFCFYLLSLERDNQVCQHAELFTYEQLILMYDVY